MSEGTRYVGLDVHKASIAVAVAGGFGDPEDHGTIPNDPQSVRRLVQRLGDGGQRLAVAYEAGPTGYALHRQLTAMGIECTVAAPSLIPVRPGERIKTDRRDAAKLARLLRSGDLVAVWVPDEAGEALRNLVRARDDAKADQLRARHRLSKFLLRRAVQPPPGVRAWSRAHERWLGRVSFDQPADRIVFEDYRQVAAAAAERVKRLEGSLLRVAGEGPQAEVVTALGAIRGIGFISAVTIAAEAGDLRRFATARQFMAYVGLVPSEWSSGPTRHRGRITKTGNRLIRHVLGQAAHNARYRPNVSDSLRARQRDVPPEIVALDRKAQAPAPSPLSEPGGSDRAEQDGDRRGPRAGRLRVGHGTARRTQDCLIHDPAGRGRVGQQHREPSNDLCDPDSRP
jgi:transposase